MARAVVARRDCVNETRAGSVRPFVEDIHFTVAEFAGSNIEHWAFVDSQLKPDQMAIRVSRLCGTAFVIIDRDSTTPEGTDKKSLRLKALQEHLKDRFVVLPVREIENLLSAAVLKKVLAAWEQVDEGSIAFKTFDEDKYSDAPLGRFIVEQVLPDGRKPRKSFFDNEGTGTILYKAEFAKLAVEAMTSWDDVSPRARDLVRRLYEFIGKHQE
ncbi:hypothetical protein PHYC_03969 [Phycisphaerales bacterium]|nr:hypothetical protein PHYC_03969 [Phycisphaerales bacterium]